jgi:hypothetical protein
LSFTPKECPTGVLHRGLLGRGGARRRGSIARHKGDPGRVFTARFDACVHRFDHVRSSPPHRRRPAGSQIEAACFSAPAHRIPPSTAQPIPAICSDTAGGLTGNDAASTAGSSKCRPTRLDPPGVVAWFQGLCVASNTGLCPTQARSRLRGRWFFRGSPRRPAGPGVLAGRSLGVAGHCCGACTCAPGAVGPECGARTRPCARLQLRPLQSRSALETSPSR